MNRPATAVATILLALALSVSGMGLATMALFSAPAVATLATYIHGESAPQSVLDTAEQTRRFVVGMVAELEIDPTGTQGFDEAAISHLLDVRGVVRTVTALAVMIVAATAVALIALLSSGGRHIVRAGLRWGGVVLAAGVALAGAAVWLGFDRFFTAFHEVLFAAGNWQFPVDSLLIQTFPESFWITAAASWIGAVMIYATVLVGLSAWAFGGAREPVQPDGPSQG